MHENELAHYHQLLLELRERLTGEIRNAVERVADKTEQPDELSHIPTHAADRDSEGLERDIVVETNRAQMVEAIDVALGRINDGTYGRCDDCGGEIPKGRLDVLPFALRCVQCEEKREKA